MLAVEVTQKEGWPWLKRGPVGGKGWRHEMIWGKGRSPLKTWNLKAPGTFPDGGTNTAQEAQKVLMHHAEAHGGWEEGGRGHQRASCSARKT